MSPPRRREKVSSPSQAGRGLPWVPGGGGCAPRRVLSLFGWGVPGASPSPRDRGGTGSLQSWGHGGASTPRGVEVVWEVGVPCPGPTSHIWEPQPPRDPKPSPQHHRERGRRGPVPLGPLLPGSPKPEQGAVAVGRGTPHAAAGTFAGPVGAPGPEGAEDALGTAWGHWATLRPAPWIPSPTDPQPHIPRTPLAAGPATPPNLPQNPSPPKSFLGPGAASSSSRHQNSAGAAAPAPGSTWRELGRRAPPPRQPFVEQIPAVTQCNCCKLYERRAFGRMGTLARAALTLTLLLRARGSPTTGSALWFPPSPRVDPGVRGFWGAPGAPPAPLSPCKPPCLFFLGGSGHGAVLSGEHWVGSEHQPCCVHGARGHTRGWCTARGAHACARAGREGRGWAKAAPGVMLQGVVCVCRGVHGCAFGCA